jgi:hypothetical protein
MKSRRIPSALLTSRASALLRIAVHDPQLITIAEAENAECLPRTLSPDLPDLIGTNQLLQVRGRHPLQALDEAENPQHLLGILRSQPIEEVFDGALAGLCP